METKITIDERILLNEAYIQTEEDFLQYCRSRGLRINEVHLRTYRERGYIKPAYNIEEHEYYDSLQVYMLWRIEKLRLYTLESPKELEHQGKAMKTQIQDWLTYLDSDFNKIQLTDAAKQFEPLFELLLSIRYYFQPEIENQWIERHTTSKIPEIIGVTPLYAQIKKLSEEQHQSLDRLRLLKYQGKSFQDQLKERELFDAVTALEKSPLGELQIFDWAVKFWMEGSDIDPLGGGHEWRVFIKNIRRTTPQRLKRLRGLAALAQDFYVVTEILTDFLQAAGKKVSIHPFDIMDGQAGKWRRTSCELCGTEFEQSDFHERFCRSCKEKIVWDKALPAGLKCKKCGNVLQRFSDGKNLFNNFLGYKAVSNSETGRPERQITMDVTLAYGSYILTITCPCGHVNELRKEAGWFT
ncbi:MAG: hypothetical protein HYR90_02890 [Candidatus Andersenbacteria bacterium]|nr:hypothetical protein [Candidatus Andersenbacteria bacterium]MBI3251104.1 hypothetical protein [Candidatus Andersenbacteria bacterium]